MFHLLLLFLPFFVNASQAEFSLTLNDKSGAPHTIKLHDKDLEFFPTLKFGFDFNKRNNKTNELIWTDPQDLKFETFDYILRPLCRDLKEFNAKTLSMEPDEILQSPGLLEDTKKVIQWIETKAKQEEKNGSIDDFVNHVFQAYYGAGFLQLPFGVKRGIVNYLYDMGVADQIVDSKDLAQNSSEWLISNRDFSPTYPAIQSGEYRIVNFMGKDFRFFDAKKAIEDVKKKVDYQFFLCFDFQNNDIQSINLDQLRTHVNPRFKNAKEGKPVFDFCHNPLSDKTKENIAQSGKEEKVADLVINYDERISHLKTEIGKARKALKDDESLRPYNRRKFFFLSGAVSLASFGLGYLASSKILLQSARKSLIRGFGSLLFLSPALMFYLYKNKRFFDVELNAQQITQKEQSIKNYEAEIEVTKKRKTADHSKEASILVDDTFYILYTR